MSGMARPSRHIGNFLNAGGGRGSPLTNISLLADGDQIKLRGTLHKLISLPVELLGSVAAAPDNRIQVHVTKFSVLKMPLKGLLGGLHISVSDLFHPKGVSGIQVSGNDIYFDTLKLLPPPHIHGQLMKVRATLQATQLRGARDVSNSSESRAKPSWRRCLTEGSRRASTSTPLV
jgi:hypothetical protein